MPDWIVSVSPTWKLLASLGLVVVLMRVRVPMGVALLAGAGLLAAIFRMPFAGFLGAVAHGMTNQQTLFLYMIVSGLLTLSSALSDTGQIQRIIESFRAMMGPSRTALVAFPALIGLLPMPGGAIFSAPMVHSAVGDSDVSSARRTIINYWFRHIWEFWLPLYPGFILAMSLTMMPVGRYILMQLPMTLFALVVGYVFLLHGRPLSGERRREITGPNVRRFAGELTPILLVVSGVVVLSFPVQALAVRMQWHGEFARQWGIPVAIVAGLAWLVARRGLACARVGRLFLRRDVLRMVLLVVGVRVFQAVIESAGAVQAVEAEFSAAHVPLAVAVSVLPFLTALIIGVAVGFVGASFPLVIALVGALPESQRLPYYFLAYVMGIGGMMASPVHLCLVMTNEYFKSRLLRVYVYNGPLVALTTAFGVALFFVYRAAM